MLVRDECCGSLPVAQVSVTLFDISVIRLFVKYRYDFDFHGKERNRSESLHIFCGCTDRQQESGDVMGVELIS